VKLTGDIGGQHIGHLGEKLIDALTMINSEQLDRRPVHDRGVTWPAEALPAALAQSDLGQLPVMGAHLSHGDVKNGSRAGVVSALHGQVEKITNDQGLRFPPLEAPGVDHSANHYLLGIDAANPSHRDEDPLPGEQLDNQPLYPWRATSCSALNDDVSYLADLVTGTVQHRQTSDPRDEDRCRCRSWHASSIPAAKR
jgi:hypothetical protein